MTCLAARLHALLCVATLPGCCREYWQQYPSSGAELVLFLLGNILLSKPRRIPLAPLLAKGDLLPADKCKVTPRYVPLSSLTPIQCMLPVACRMADRNKSLSEVSQNA